MLSLCPRNVLSSCKAAPGDSEGLGTSEAVTGLWPRTAGRRRVPRPQLWALFAGGSLGMDRAFGGGFLHP